MIRFTHSIYWSGSSLYTELLLDNASIKPFEVTDTALGGTQKYHTDGTHEYRLEVKTAFNSETGKCECPAISGRAPVDKNGTAYTDGSVYETINSTYGEHIDTEYGCTYAIPEVTFKFYKSDSMFPTTPVTSISINTIKYSFDNNGHEPPNITATGKTYWLCKWVKPEEYTGFSWSDIQLKTGWGLKDQNESVSSMSPGQFDQFFVSELPSTLTTTNYSFKCTDE